MDQAESLRNLMNKNEYHAGNQSSRSLSSRVITVTSGKGGVGKTNFSANLGIEFSRQGKRVVIIDADFGLANIEVILGVMPKYSLADVLRGDRDISEVITDGPEGIKFISGGSGLKELANISERQLNYFINNFAYLDTISDVIIVDTGAGISPSVINFIKASDETVIVTTPEPTSITDAYALIKTVIFEKGEDTVFNIVMNRVDDEKEALEVFSNLSRVAKKFLRIDVNWAGFIPYDKYLVKAVKAQEPAVIAYPDCEFSDCVAQIACNMMNIEYKKTTAGIKGFVKKLAGIFG